MADTSSRTSLSWACSACARTVPARVDTCRCGASRNGHVEPVVVIPTGTPSRGTPVLQWILLGAILVIAAGALVMLQMTPAKREQPPITKLPTLAPTFATDEPIAPSGTPDAPAYATNGSIAPAGTPDAPTFATGESIAPVGKPVPLEDVVSRSIPAIVSIEAGQGRGSGFFATPNTVVTNRHVVQGAMSVTVKLSSGQALSGRVDASSAEYDLALIRVDAASPAQPTLPLGRVDDVRAGQEVIAIGLALGVFQNSVTRGIISGVRRVEQTVVLQTDAAINPGNSGGPLLNRQGLVVGINTMKIAGAAESLGFAVAADHARSMLSGGRRVTAAVSESAPASRALAPAFNTGSSTDTARADGTRRYDDAVHAAARKAAQLDSYWDRIKARCAVRVSGAYDREWFAVWEGRAGLASADLSCGDAVGEFETLAAGVRQAMVTAEDDARRASVLPGQLRHIRRRHRMDWTGFD